MKRFYITTLITLLGVWSAKAQDKNVFNHLSIGLNAGTPGIGADVAMPACKFVQLRAGFAVLPKITMNTELDLNDNNYFTIPGGTNIPTGLNEIDVQGKLNMVNGKVLVDLLPFIHSNFHVTVGAYFGKGDIVSVYNREDGALLPINQANEAIRQYNQTYGSTYGMQKELGLELGDYLLTPDEQGNAKASINTKSFRPYVGIGFGRAVPRKRVGFMFDLGCMFWNHPTVQCNGVELTEQNLGDNGGNIIKTISKITVYPCLNLRLSGRIF